MTPQDFCVYPWDSVFQQSESETIALNIMKILAQTGNEFRELSYEEYEARRQRDGNYSARERAYFEKVVPYCVSEQAVRTFSPTWRAIS